MENLDLVIELLGGTRALGSAPRTLLDLVEHIRAGLSPKSVERLTEQLEMSEDELCAALGIPRRTLTRRKNEPRLDPKESEAVLRLARVAGRAADVLGDLAAAHRWLRKPNRALGGRTPLSLLDTELGAELVTDVLGRIEHGVFS